jgi:hypothetical protein
MERTEPVMPSDDAVLPVDAGAPSASGDRMVMVALDLGWQLAELYAAVRPDNLQPPGLPAGHPGPEVAQPEPPPDHEPRIRLQADLPGAGGLAERQKRELMFDQIDVSARYLRPRLDGAGLALPERPDWPRLSRHLRSAEGRYQLAAAILRYHGDLLIRLTAADHRLGQAYGLGRALADLSLRPEAADQRSFTSDLRFGGRIAVISSWLRELHTALPDHAAGAVTGSIAQWQAWAASPQWDGGPLQWAEHGSTVVAALRRQGMRWRSLLTGRAGPLDELAPDDYVDAAGYLLGRIRRILQRLLLQYWPAVLIGTLLMVAAVVAAFAFFPAPAGKAISAGVSFLAWLGITGRLVSGALQRAVGQAENSLWQGELDLAVAWAVTELPNSAIDRTLGEPARSMRPGAARSRLKQLSQPAGRPSA